MDYREGQLGSCSKKYVWTCKAGQSKRQAAMQTVNKLDSLSSHLMNQTTARIRHKWSMNLRMDWECLSVFKKPDRSPAGHCSLSWFSVLRQGADVSLLYTGLIQISQRTAANTEPPQSACFCSSPCDLYSKSTNMYECSKKSEKKKHVENVCLVD